MGGAIFSQFFLLTLYMQQVLHYSAIQTGVAYIGADADDHRLLGGRAGAGDPDRRAARAAVGLALSTAALVLFARLPVHGSYFSDLFPAFIISGLGLALAFVPMSIGGADRRPAGRRGIASG